VKRTPIRKKSKSTTSKLQSKCDKLLSPIVIKQNPVCIFYGLKGAENCTYYTQVAHHHVHKSKSSRLRYEIDNLVNLCNHCHLMLHHNESYWASKVVELRGIEWFKNLEKSLFSSFPPFKGISTKNLQ
jgi:5-methylcytosine-specific restriction endonuclease McrA